jgi:hypothetical protein
MIALLMLYPGLSAVRLVGTDLVQAVPLVASASLGHLLFGDFQLDLTASLLECSRRWLYQAPCGALEACVCTQVLHPSVGRHCRMIRIRRSRAFFSEGRRWASTGFSARWRWPEASA